MCHAVCTDCCHVTIVTKSAPIIVILRLMDRVDNDETSHVFIVLCFVLRVFLALGCTASATASFAVTANIFPNNVATVFGMLETATGLGMMIGPALGGLLYQVSTDLNSV